MHPVVKVWHGDLQRRLLMWTRYDEYKDEEILRRMTGWINAWYADTFVECSSSNSSSKLVVVVAEVHEVLVLYESLLTPAPQVTTQRM